MPEGSELKVTMENIYSPSIDSTWFPNTQASYYWASEPDAGDPKRAKVVQYDISAYVIVPLSRSNGTTHVRLVRASQRTGFASLLQGTRTWGTSLCIQAAWQVGSCFTGTTESGCQRLGQYAASHRPPVPEPLPTAGWALRLHPQ